MTRKAVATHSTQTALDRERPRRYQANKGNTMNKNTTYVAVIEILGLTADEFKRDLA